MRTKKNLILLAAIAAAVCLTLGLSLRFERETKKVGIIYGKTFTAFASDGEATGETVIYKTMGNKSQDKNYLLLATAVAGNMSEYKAVGYEVKKDGGEAEKRSTDKYYTGISVRTSAEDETARTVFTVADIYDETVTTENMIVDEIPYSQKSQYVIKAFMVKNDDTVTYGAEVTVKWVDTAVEDTGEKTPNVFEFEGAEFNGTSKDETYKCVGKSYAFSADLSGNIGLKNISVGSKFSFTFNSDKNVRVPVKFVFATYTTKGRKLGDVFGVTVNGYGAADLSAIVPSTGTAADGLNPTYFTMVEVAGALSLEKGENVIEVTVRMEGVNPDRMTIETSATLGGYTPQYWATDFVEVTKAPTETEKGSILISCPNNTASHSGSYALPVLGSDCYTLSGSAGDEVYTLTLAGQTVIVKAKYLLTLSGATFEDGSTQQRVFAGESPTVNVTIPDGRKLSGWCNVENAFEYYPGAQIVMPNKNITLAPLFEPTTYYSNASRVGKIESKGKLYDGKEQGCYSVTGKDGKIAPVLNGDGSYELGNIYHFKGGTAANPKDTMAVGAHFLTTTNDYAYSGSSGATKTVTYTVKNFGTEEVTLRFALIKQSSNPNSQYGEKTVTIAAGTITVFSFDITYLHNTFMTNVMVKEKAVSEVYIGFFMYITDKT